MLYEAGVDFDLSLTADALCGAWTALGQRLGVRPAATQDAL